MSRLINRHNALWNQPDRQDWLTWNMSKRYKLTLAGVESVWTEVCSSKFSVTDTSPVELAGHEGTNSNAVCSGLPHFWKKWNCPYLLNLLVYFDKILHTHYYWHDIDRGIAKSSPRDCKITFNIGRGCASSKFWKSENGQTEWTIVMKLCKHIDTDKM